MLAASYEGVRNGVLSALFRGAIDFAARHGCTSIDLGPGGADIKSRLGAQAVQPKCMVVFADWRLRAQTRAAGRSELYTELLERVRESAVDDRETSTRKFIRKSVGVPDTIEAQRAKTESETPLSCSTLTEDRFSCL